MKNDLIELKKIADEFIKKYEKRLGDLETKSILDDSEKSMKETLKRRLSYLKEHRKELNELE
jgi:hypothetical protein